MKHGPGLAVWRPGWAAGSPPKAAHDVIYLLTVQKRQTTRPENGQWLLGPGRRLWKGRETLLEEVPAQQCWGHTPVHLCQNSINYPLEKGARLLLVNCTSRTLTLPIDEQEMAFHGQGRQSVDSTGLTNCCPSPLHGPCLNIIKQVSLPWGLAGGGGGGSAQKAGHPSRSQAAAKMTQACSFHSQDSPVGS